MYKYCIALYMYMENANRGILEDCCGIFEILHSDFSQQFTVILQITFL